MCHVNGRESSFIEDQMRQFFANFNFHDTSCNWVYIMNTIFQGEILKLSESQFLTSYHTPSKWEQNLNSGLENPMDGGAW